MYSFIEGTSGAALLWRLSLDAEHHRRERTERITLKIVGACFLALAAYVAYEAVGSLIAGKAPEHSLPGIILACVSLVVMPLLSRAKRRVGAHLKSAAMHADAKQTEFCTYLSATLLGACCSMPFLTCGGPTPPLRSSWFPSSQRKG